VVTHKDESSLLSHNGGIYGDEIYGGSGSTVVSSPPGSGHDLGGRRGLMFPSFAPLPPLQIRPLADAWIGARRQIWLPTPLLSRREASPGDGGSDGMFLRCSTLTVKEEWRRSTVANPAAPPLLPRWEATPETATVMTSSSGARRRR
jgi:hypothetical protein